MNWLDRKMTRLAALPGRLLFAHFVSRTMIGIGAGFLMSAYTRLDPEFGGWFNLLAGVAIGIPSTIAVLRAGRATWKEARRG
jgi:hypothetical protein